MTSGAPWYYDPFVIPFYIGMTWLFTAVLYKWIKWFADLPSDDKKLVRHNIFSNKSLKAIEECVMECLVHRRIWKTNRVLGYMHMSLALGWFLLIIIGKFETTAYLRDAVNPPHVHVFFRFFFPEEPHTFVRNFNYAFLMDLLLVFVLSGVVLAWIKRIRSKLMGMRRTTKHTPFDRLALSSLWFIFPLRWLAESTTCAIHNSGDFFTGGTGDLLSALIPQGVLSGMEHPLWWAYSVSLAVFFIAMPYSRYMHIFTEVPLIFLRNYKLKSRPEGSSFDNFQLEACSRCGICLDPCPIAAELNITNIQAAYFVRDRRYGYLTEEIANTCLMCGRCSVACPVGVEVDTLRLSSRVGFAKETESYDAERYEYLEGEAKPDLSSGEGKVGFFAGCMTQLTPSVMKSMEKIFDAAGVDVWWADKEGGVCCGRPMRLSGNLPASEKMEAYNTELFKKHGIKTLVTGCPICYKSFSEDYTDLKGIRVLHHSQFIAEQIAGGKLKTSVIQTSYAYHDPCELRGIYSEPRYILNHVGSLTNSKINEKDPTHCCGGSLANLTLDTGAQTRIGAAVVDRLVQTEAEVIVTSCPQCKKSLQRSAISIAENGQPVQVIDLAEAVARAI